MKKISLTQNLIACVSNKDYPRVSKYCWHADRRKNMVYARGYVNGQHVYLHRFILGISDDKEVDHKDGDGLNCKRRNLRVCTVAQNQQAFQYKRRNATSKFRGVHWVKRISRWMASINPKGKTIYLGYFENEIEAALAYDAAAKKRFGGFVHLNFPARI